MSLEQEFASTVRPWALAGDGWRPKNAAIRNRTMAPYMAVSVTFTGNSNIGEPKLAAPIALDDVGHRRACGPPRRTAYRSLG
jgi:hypothetical protein